jgi:hypothetical protein
MNNIEIKSFKILPESIELYEDADGTDCALVIPKWMFNQIVEKCFVDVRVK